MITKESIQKLNRALRRGDQNKIAALAETSRKTVSLFFNGSEDLVSDETSSKIIEAAEKVIHSRAELRKSAERKVKNITKSYRS